MIDKSAIDPNALQFYRILKEAGYSAYFVGGSVRDLLLGKEPKDFDIATNATPHQIKRVIPQGRIIGRRFRHVMLEKNGGRYEIVTFRGPVLQAEALEELDDESVEDQPTGDVPTDAADAPSENRGREGRDRDRQRNYPDLNQFGNAQQDAIRRDFTINALFYDPDADELVDYVEGKLDIDRKIVRTIGDPQVRMEEDPIRILRAIRHKMKLGLEYDAALETAMRDKAPLLADTSKDRIREEFLKVCNDHSLGSFLTEGKRMGLVPHIMPWFEGMANEAWEGSTKLWEKFRTEAIPERHSADMGLALMMVSLVDSLVLEPYRATLKEGEKNYLPDMKYFLSCEPLRNFYLRNLRISRAQTDHLVRALFYFSRMSGLWLEQGPPRRIIGRLFQHPPAVLAAKMAKLQMELESKEVPEWLKELAEYEGKRPNRRDEERGGRERGRDRGRGRDRDREGEVSPEEQEFSDAGTAQAGESSSEGEDDSGGSERRPERSVRDRGERSERNERSERSERPERPERESQKAQRLPPPDQPLVWNGPLHAPVLRPVFNEEPAIRWARKNQTVRAFRPSGIPNQATDHSLAKSNLVYNYKPEIEGGGPREEGSGGSGESERGGPRRGRGRERDRGGRTRSGGRDRGERGGSERKEAHGDRGDRPEPRGERPEANGSEQQPHREQPPHSDRERSAQPDRERRPSQPDRDRPERTASPGNDRPTPRHDRGQRPSRGNNHNENRGPRMVDEDSIGNILRPGEVAAPLHGLNNAVYDDYEDGDDQDDNIGNRLDAPPTSGHVGVNGEGVLGNQRHSQNRSGGGPRHGRSGGGASQGAGNGGGQGGNNARRGRRRGRRGGGGQGQGQGRSGPPRGHDTP